MFPLVSAIGPLRKVVVVNVVLEPVAARAVPPPMESLRKFHAPFNVGASATQA